MQAPSASPVSARLRAEPPATREALSAEAHRIEAALDRFRAWRSQRAQEEAALIAQLSAHRKLTPPSAQKRPTPSPPNSPESDSNSPNKPKKKRGPPNKAGFFVISAWVAEGAVLTLAMQYAGLKKKLDQLCDNGAEGGKNQIAQLQAAAND